MTANPIGSCRSAWHKS